MWYSSQLIETKTKAGQWIVEYTGALICTCDEKEYFIIIIIILSRTNFKPMTRLCEIENAFLSNVNETWC